MATGTKDLIGFAIESVFGTAPAAPTKAWPFRGDRPTPRMEAANDEDSKVGVQEFGSESVVVRRWVEASGLEMDARMDALAFWLYVTLGKITTTGTNPLFTHKIENNGGQKPSLTAYWRDDLTPSGKLEAYPGLKVQRLTIRSQQGGKLLILPELIGKGATTDNGFAEVTAAMAALNRDLPLTHGKFTKVLVGTYELKSLVQSTELIIEPQYSINEEFGGNGEFIHDLECSGLLVTTNFNFNHNADTKALIDKVLTQTGVPIETTLALGTHSYDLTLPKVFQDDTAVTGGKAKLKKSFSGKVYYDLTTSKALEATVKNATASYAA